MASISMSPVKKKAEKKSARAMLLDIKKEMANPLEVLILLRRC
jgi:hypothetical protein